MLPSQLVVPGPLPLSASGKIDHRALERELATMTEQPQAPSRPLTDDETRMARLWEEVLERRSLDPDASFFDSGGHSLAAMRVIARVQETFTVDIPVRVLFEAPTLAAFTRAVAERRDQQQADGPVLRRMPRQPVDRAAAGQRSSR
jgi:acyl carrier protein